MDLLVGREVGLPTEPQLAAWLRADVRSLARMHKSMFIEVLTGRKELAAKSAFPIDLGLIGT